MSQANIDFDRCLERLLTQKGRLDRDIESMLAKANLPADIFARLPKLLAHLPNAAVAKAKAKLPTNTPPSLDAGLARLRRLSRRHEQLTHKLGQRLIRA